MHHYWDAEGAYVGVKQVCLSKFTSKLSLIFQDGRNQNSQEPLSNQETEEWVQRKYRLPVVVWVITKNWSWGSLNLKEFLRLFKVSNKWL